MAVEHAWWAHRSDNLLAQPAAVRKLLLATANVDWHTYQHLVRVGMLTRRLAVALGLPPAGIAAAWRAGLLHDVGKSAIPLSVLNKPVRLTDDEVQVMASHPDRGAELLRAIPELASLAALVRHHHEWYDGGGYPGRLAGEQIPPIARMIAVTDAYDAMTSPRPYAPTRTPAQALAELERCAGTQFDPHLVERFVHLMRNGEPFQLGSTAGPVLDRPPPLAVRILR